MPIAAHSWSFTEHDFGALQQVLQRFLTAGGCHTAMLIDRSGQMITSEGKRPGFDADAFASLAAADFSANDQLARLVGENDFTSLYHQGDEESIFLAAVGDRLLLAGLFNKHTPPGLVRLRAKETTSEISSIVARMAADAKRVTTPVPGILSGAEDEIDQLFK